MVRLEQLAAAGTGGLLAVVGLRAATGGVLAAGTAPMAHFTFSPSSPALADPVTFDAAESASFDAAIESYEWDFDDGTTAAGQVVSHTFGAGGNFTVTLTVRDANGNRDTVQQTVPVGSPANAVPTPAFTWSPVEPQPGETVVFDGSTSSDPDGTIAAFEWTIAGETFSGATVTTTFEAEGTVDAQLVVTDDLGAKTALRQSVVVGLQDGFGIDGFGLGGFGDPTTAAALA